MVASYELLVLLNTCMLISDNEPKGKGRGDVAISYRLPMTIIA